MTKTIQVWVLLAAIFCGCGPIAKSTTVPQDTSVENQEEQTSGNALGNISLKDINDRNVSLSESASGKTVILSFFATYCEGCKQKTTDHQLLHDKYGDKGLAVIAISVDEPETSGNVRLFAKSRNLTFPILLDTNSEATNQLNPRRSLPFSLIMSKSGKIVWTHEGYVPGDDKLIEDHIVQVLAEDNP